MECVVSGESKQGVVGACRERICDIGGGGEGAVGAGPEGEAEEDALGCTER